MRKEWHVRQKRLRNTDVVEIMNVVQEHLFVRFAKSDMLGMQKHLTWNELIERSNDETK
jgi:hypothetical protein